MISVFDLFRTGLGPSSSHTVGPMRAATAFTKAVLGHPRRSDVRRFQVVLYGSLAWTGRGHATDTAIVLGLLGIAPEDAEPDRIPELLEEAKRAGGVRLGGRRIAYVPETDLIWDRSMGNLAHPNTLALRALTEGGETVLEQRWCSIGGGFICAEDAVGNQEAVEDWRAYPFRTARELLDVCAATSLSIGQIMLANEPHAPGREAAEERLDQIAAAMMDCINRGLRRQGVLPGGLNVRRRAPDLYQKLQDDRRRNAVAETDILDRVSVYAIAVNEENAAGGRVVTAPTNGAAGIVPAVLRYYLDSSPEDCVGGAREFLLTAAAVGFLFKLNASISGAEVGCQGEVGVACAMAAAGLAAALGGSPAQVENAAEMGMEHNLGLTCDPIGGLVQIPCIERNAFGAVKAVNAASLALHGDGTHRVSLDMVIETMKATGRDMHVKYKETALGGLAVALPEC